MSVEKFYYQIGVADMNYGIESDKPLDDDEVILKAYEDDQLHGDDCHCVRYVEELTEEEYNQLYKY